MGLQGYPCLQISIIGSLLRAIIVPRGDERMIAGLTGHRPTDLWGFRSHPGYKMLSEQLAKTCLRLVTERGADTFLSGMALGADTIAFDACVRIREKHPIQVVAVVPYEMQAARWAPEHQARYRQRLSRADEVVYVDMLDQYSVPGVPVGMHHSGKLLAYNQYIVDQAKVVVAVWWPKLQKGNTFDVVGRAQKAGRELVIIDPFTLYRR